MLKAQAQVKTEKASRYLKALCNHFNRKVTAEYNDTQGSVQFGFADCVMVATEDALGIRIQADNAENFERVKYVVSDHLVRFGNNESLDVTWVDES